MRAIVIDSRNRTVIETDVDASLDSLQQIVGGPIEPVDQGLDEDHHCYVNEEGLFDNPQHFFMFTDGHQPLAGNGIILASTEDGDEAPCRLPLEWVKELVTFMDFNGVWRWCREHDQGEEAPNQPEPKPMTTKIEPARWLYRPLLRPASFCTLPEGLSWNYLEIPSEYAAGRPDLPISRHRFGIIATTRELTAKERHTFDLEQVFASPYSKD